MTDLLIEKKGRDGMENEKQREIDLDDNEMTEDRSRSVLLYLYVVIVPPRSVWALRLLSRKTQIPYLSEPLVAVSPLP